MSEEDERKKFEGFILNNRMDDPKKFGLRRTMFDAYEDQRLNYAWAVWKELTINA